MGNWHYHVISNTHWDREWRYPFQVYRMDLVDMMDKLLYILENDERYNTYLLDSQTVLLEDYLEIRPENKEKIRSFVEEGRLQIGPWYTLPDEWGCPGEALVRNLLMGHRVAREFGRVMKVGYTPFSNGQISQMPQLYQGFGINSCFFYRGIGKHIAPSDFIWEGPDGSRLFGFRFGDYARYNYYYLVYRPGLLGRTIHDREYEWKPEEIPYHVAVEHSQDRQYRWLNQKLQVHEEFLPQALSGVFQETYKEAQTRQLLYMMGHDHSYPASEECDLIEAARKYLDSSKEKLLHSDLETYMELFEKEAEDLPVVTGEMRHTLKEGLWTTLMAPILSCRLYLKQMNCRVNTRVMHESEPLASLAWLNGAEYPARYFELAWKKLLINQAHDAIGGCSIDRVHQEMIPRWTEVESLSDEICRRSMANIMKTIDGSSIDPSHLQLTIFNSLPFERSGITECIIDIPVEMGQDKMFCIETVDGDPVPIQILSDYQYQPTIEGGYELSMPFEVQRFRTSIYLENIPSLGYQTFVIKPGKTPREKPKNIIKSDNEMENEFFQVRINPNGTLWLREKVSGRTFDNLCCLEDTAEFGDPWNRIGLKNEKPFYSLKQKARISTVHNGPLKGTLRIDLDFPVPAYKDSSSRRSEDMINLPVTLYVTLLEHSTTLDIRVELENTARDHRLRMLFPSGIKNAEHSFAEGQFDVLSRPIQLPSSEGWKESPYPTHPMWNFVDVSDGNEGFAVINDGLIEYEVIDDKERTVAITLLRSFGKFIFERPTPEAQCQGKHTYNFYLYPHAGYWDETEIFQIKTDKLVPLQAVESAPTRGTEDTLRSFLSFDSDALVCSAIKQSEDQKSLVLRIFNPLSKNKTTTLCTHYPIRRAHLLSLEEQPVKELHIKKDNTVLLELAPKKILTVGLQF